MNVMSQGIPLSPFHMNKGHFVALHLQVANLKAAHVFTAHSKVLTDKQNGLPGILYDLRPFTK